MAKSPARGAPAPAKPKLTAKVERTKTSYNTKKVRWICEQLEGGATVSDISRMAEGPSQKTIYNWMNKHPGFREMVTAARDRGAAALAEEVLDIARGVTPETASADRVKLQGVQWAAGKGSPLRRNDRPGLSGPTEVTIRVRRFQKLFDENGRAFLREIFPEGEG